MTLLPKFPMQSHIPLSGQFSTFFFIIVKFYSIASTFTRHDSINREQHLKFFLGLLSILISTSAFSSSEKNKSVTFLETSVPHEIIIEVASFLDDKSLGRLVKIDKSSKIIFSRDNNEIGGDFREFSRFAISDHAGHVYFLEEFLSLSGLRSISKAKNIRLLVKEKPNEFIKLVLKSIPRGPKNVQNKLELFYTETMRNLLDDLPVYETSQKKLAVLLYDLLGCFYLMDQICSQIYMQIVEKQARISSLLFIFSQIFAQAIAHSMSHVMTPIASQINAQVLIQLCLHVLQQVYLAYRMHTSLQSQSPTSF